MANLSTLEAGDEERLDIEDARAARREAEEKGTISLEALRRELEPDPARARSTP